MSIATHTRIASALEINARLVDLLLVIVVLPPYAKFFNDNM